MAPQYVRKNRVFVGMVLLSSLAAIAATSAPDRSETDAAATAVDESWDTVTPVAAEIDAILNQHAESLSLKPLPPADDLQVARRLSLVLAGAIPSLEEIREIERQSERRIDGWIDRLLADRRFADYFAERLKRAMAPNIPAEPFFVYRQRRFVTWLSEQIAADRAYDDLVREIISAEGLWTDHPATNFITGNERMPNRLASRSVRAFLGLRIDCAECHDHPFAPWTQADFQGLSAYFGQAELGFVGIRDGDKEYEIEDPKTKEKRVIAPAVPFDPELLSDEGRRREQLAQWVTHRDNPYFAKAIVNRVWRLLFGQALIEPVDNLENEELVPGALDRLAADFRDNGHDLKRLIRVITATQAFRRQSAANVTIDEEAYEAAYASYPVTRLRPEQVAGAIVQSASLHTITSDSTLLKRFQKLIGEKDFVERYGDADTEELTSRSGNITQRLLMMNGKVSTEHVAATPFSAAGRLSALAPTDEACVETAYLVCLTRRPTEPEREYFVQSLSGLTGDKRSRAVEDMFWALFNSTEFAWNH